MLRGIEAEIVARQVGDVDQAVDVEAVEGHEYAEARDPGDRAVEGLAHLVLHVPALEPRLDVARRVVGATLAKRAVHAQIGPVRARRLVLPAGEHRPDRTVDEEVGIAPDRRGEAVSYTHLTLPTSDLV